MIIVDFAFDEAPSFGRIISPCLIICTDPKVEHGVFST
jgi:hypothetical protein